MADLGGFGSHPLLFLSFFVYVCSAAVPGGLQERPWQDSHCFLGQLFLHGRPSRPPTYLGATPGMWCFERPRSSADSDRQGLCVLSVWKRQPGPGICLQLLSPPCTHTPAHADVASHTPAQARNAGEITKGNRSEESHRDIRLSGRTPGRQCPTITSRTSSNQWKPRAQWSLIDPCC